MKSRMSILRIGIAIVFLASEVSSARQTTTSGPRPAGIVRGHVVDATTGAPIAFAVVTMTLARPYSQHRRIAADEQGRFAFDAVAPDVYYVAATQEPYVVGYANSASPGQPGEPVVVQRGRELDDLTVALSPGAVLAGRVFDANGDPAAHVQMMIRRDGGPVFNGPVQSTEFGAGTDDDGNYRFCCLPPGNYIVSADGADEGGFRLGRFDGPLVRYVDTFFPSVTSIERAQVVSLKVGEERVGLDIRRTMTRLYSINGTVVRSAGSAEDRYVRVEARRKGDYRTASAIVADDGTFVVDRLAPGDYWLIATDGDDERYGALPLTVVDRDVVGLSLSLEPTVAISGRVVVQGDTTKLKALTDLDIMTEPDYATAASEDKSAALAESGAFRIDQRRPGRYTLSVWAPMFEFPTEILTIRSADHTWTSASIDVPPGGLTDLVITVRPKPR